MYESEKMRLVQIISRMRGEGIKQNDRGIEFKIYCKHFCKCHNAPQYNKNMTK
jgi:hypothetical protein